ncbi:MAG TPA: hypothetical protein DEG69_05575 [Flavobacteriaceae bacterium]|nr:hypothetical protein [Flavobacteriaceae bacterium]
MFRVRVDFGEDMDPVNEETYHFETKAEVKAFFLGLQEGEGWQRWTVIEDQSKTLPEDSYEH